MTRIYWPLTVTGYNSEELMLTSLFCTATCLWPYEDFRCKVKTKEYTDKRYWRWKSVTGCRAERHAKKIINLIILWILRYGKNYENVIIDGVCTKQTCSLTVPKHHNASFTMVCCAIFYFNQKNWSSYDLMHLYMYIYIYIKCLIAISIILQ